MADSVRLDDLQKASDDAFPAAPPDAVQPCPDSHWIEIELIDPHGGPQANEPFILRAAGGGDERSGRLDALGFARVEGLHAGLYEVSFPERNKGAWQPS